MRGAREHNLKGVDVEIPRESLTVITGLSAVGQVEPRLRHHLCRGAAALRRESLSAYARQFLEMMQKPDVEHIDGLSPAISIEQKTTSRNPRSTVATVTEIYDYMRLLWARVGVPYSPATGLPIEAQTVSQMVDRTMALPEGSRHYLLAPVVRGRKGEYRKELAEWQKAGFTRVRIDGEFYDIEEAPALDKKYKHDIEVVVDRIVIREGIESRLADSFETALKLAEGLAYPRPRRPARAEAATPTQHVGHEARLSARPGRIVFSEKFACPVSGFTIAEIEPRLFSLQRPAGRLPGLRRARREDAVRRGSGRPQPRAVDRQGRGRAVGQVASRPRLITCRCSAAWRAPTTSSSPRRGASCPRKRAQVILRGTRGKPVTLRFVDGRKSYEVKKPFEGVLGNLERRMLSTESAWMREELSRYQASHPCEVCHGARLRPEPLSVKIAGEDISQSARRSVADALGWFSTLDAQARRRSSARSPAPILKEINARLGFLHNVGLDYLNLDRTSGTLVRRREPAHPPRQPDRQRPVGRALRPRRAVDRPPPEGQ